jgi:hypothetical protein
MVDEMVVEKVDEKVDEGRHGHRPALTTYPRCDG